MKQPLEALRLRLTLAVFLNKLEATSDSSVKRILYEYSAVDVSRLRDLNGWVAETYFDLED